MRTLTSDVCVRVACDLRVGLEECRAVDSWRVDTGEWTGTHTGRTPAGAQLTLLVPLVLTPSYGTT